MTNHEIDPEHPANSDPENATAAEVEAALEDGRLFNRPLLMKFDGVCPRCESKNRKRRLAGVDESRERVRDGEHVRFFAYHVPEEQVEHETAPLGYWRISKVLCADHPPLPFGETISETTHQVRGLANVDDVEGDGHRLRNVSIEARSPAGQGPERTLVEQRREQYVTDGSGDHPGGVVVVPPEEPEPTWPEETRDWLAELVEEHGPLEQSPPTPPVWVHER